MKLDLSPTLDFGKIVFVAGWIKTITKSPPPDQQTSTKYTYVITMGRKGNDHNEVNTIHNEELEQLKNCAFRYYGASQVRRNMPVMLKNWQYLLIDLNDAP